MKIFSLLIVALLRVAAATHTECYDECVEKRDTCDAGCDTADDYLDCIMDCDRDSVACEDACGFGDAGRDLAATDSPWTPCDDECEKKFDECDYQCGGDDDEDGKCVIACEDQLNLCLESCSQEGRRHLEAADSPCIDKCNNDFHDCIQQCDHEEKCVGMCYDIVDSCVRLCNKGGSRFLRGSGN